MKNKKHLLSVVLLFCTLDILFGGLLYEPVPVTERSAGSGIVNGVAKPLAVSNSGQVAFMAEYSLLDSTPVAIVAENPYLYKEALIQIIPATEKKQVFDFEVNVYHWVSACSYSLTSDNSEFFSAFCLASEKEKYGSTILEDKPYMFYRFELSDGKGPRYDYEVALSKKTDTSYYKDNVLLTSSDLKVAVRAVQNGTASKIQVLKGDFVMGYTVTDILSDYISDIPAFNFAMTGDGKTLYFPLEVKGEYYICSADLEDDNPIPETVLHLSDTSKGTTVFAVSQDGYYLAVHDFDASKKGVITVYEVESDGRLIFDCELTDKNYVNSMSFSGNGKYLAFITGKSSTSICNPCRFNRLSKKAEFISTLTGTVQTAISPDGRYQAYTVAASTSSSIDTVYLAYYAEEEESYRDYIAKTATSWKTSEDGNTLVFKYGTKLYYWSTNITTPRIISGTNTVQNYTISADGKTIYFASTTGLYGVPVVDKEPADTPSKLKASTEVNVYTALATNKDGSNLYYQYGNILYRMYYDEDTKKWVDECLTASLQAGRTIDYMAVSYDESMIVFHNDASKTYALTDEMSEPLLINSTLWTDYLGELLLDGLSLSYLNDEAITSQYLSIKTTGEESSEIDVPDDYDGLALSADGRSLILADAENKLYQMRPGSDEAPQEVLDSGYDAITLVGDKKPVLNPTGDKLFFIDSKGLERAIVKPPVYTEPDLESNKYVLDERCTYGEEDNIPVFPLVFADPDANVDAPAVVPGTITSKAKYGTVEVLPPLPASDSAERRNYYSLRYISTDKHFFGTDKLTISCYDGTTLNKYTINITVNDAPDAPEWEIEEWTPSAQPLPEGQAASFALPEFTDIDDPLLQEDYAITIQGADAHLHAAIQNDALFLEPDYDTTTRTAGNKQFQFAIRVTDEGGLYDDLTVFVTVSDTNRKPTLSVTSIKRSQFVKGNEVFTWNELGPNDLDPEDKDNLKIVVTDNDPAKFSFLDKNQTTISSAVLASGIAQTSFPITVVPASSAVDELSWNFAAIDLMKETSKPAEVTYELVRQTYTMSELFKTAIDPETGEVIWPQFGKGWNLLACNVYLSPETLANICTMLATPADSPIWYWNVEANAFAPVSTLPNGLEPGQAFLIYAKKLPDAEDATKPAIVIVPGDDYRMPSVRGWYLRAPLEDNEFAAEDPSKISQVMDLDWHVLRAPLHVGDDTTLEANKPYWLFYEGGK